MFWGLSDEKGNLLLIFLLTLWVPRETYPDPWGSQHPRFLGALFCIAGVAYVPRCSVKPAQSPWSRGLSHTVRITLEPPYPTRPHRINQPNQILFTEKLGDGPLWPGVCWGS